MTRPLPPPPGVIAANELYSLREFQRRTRLGDAAMRTARRRGLRTIKIGTAVFVFGADFHEFAKRQAERQEAATTTQ